jgi:hypothetical protein
VTAGQVTLTFEHETAAATSLAGLGSQVEVLHFGAEPYVFLAVISVVA